MNVVYSFDLDSVDDLLECMAHHLQRRRLEKNISRRMLSELSGVPTPTITKFELEYKISLSSYVALVKALGYTEELKMLLAEPKYSTIQEIDTINKNKNRKRGRNETSR